MFHLTFMNYIPVWIIDFDELYKDHTRSQSHGTYSLKEKQIRNRDEKNHSKSLRDQLATIMQTDILIVKF